MRQMVVTRRHGDAETRRRGERIACGTRKQLENTHTIRIDERRLLKLHFFAVSPHPDSTELVAGRVAVSHEPNLDVHRSAQ